VSVPWRVGIIGAGQMAQGFDAPGAPQILSMAHAFSCAPRFQVAGFFDQQPGRAAAAEQRWGVAPTPRDRGRWLAGGWDVIYIATPDREHATDLAAALDVRPRAVLVEKPLALDAGQAIALLDRAEGQGTAVLVNYPRRHHSVLTTLQRMAAAGELSPPTSVFAAVSGGAAHNLPHVIDLMRDIWGGGWQITGEPRRGELVTLHWRRGDTAFWMCVADRESAFYTWEAHFHCREGKLEVSKSPEILEWSVPAPHPDYVTYRVLRPRISVGMEEEPLLPRVADALAEVLDDAARAAAALAVERETQRLVGAALTAFETV
jgi:predicted dehydrogenase